MVSGRLADTARPGTSEWEECMALLDATEAYEDYHWPIVPPSYAAMVEHRAEHMRSKTDQRRMNGADRSGLRSRAYLRQLQRRTPEKVTLRTHAVIKEKSVRLKQGVRIA